MFNSQQMEEYRRLRADGLDPRTARGRVKGYTRRQPTFEWSNGYSRGTMWESKKTEHTNEGPVEVIIRIVHDGAPDLSWIGTFHNNEVAGAENWHHFMGIRGRDRTRIMQWFRPYMSYEEILQDTHGMSRQDAHLHARDGVRDQMERMREIENQDSFCVGIVATAYLDNVELGEDQCFGFIVNPSRDDHWDYINHSAQDIVDTAVAHATHNLCPHCRGSGRREDG